MHYARMPSEIELTLIKNVISLELLGGSMLTPKCNSCRVIKIFNRLLIYSRV